MTKITRHAFLAPGHNCWSLWTAEGTKTFTNQGESHRLLETLAYSINMMSNEGWHVQQIFVEDGLPNLVLLTREDMSES